MQHFSIEGKQIVSNSITLNYIIGEPWNGYGHVRGESESLILWESLIVHIIPKQHFTFIFTVY